MISEVYCVAVYCGTVCPEEKCDHLLRSICYVDVDIPQRGNCVTNAVRQSRQFLVI